MTSLSIVEALHSVRLQDQDLRCNISHAMPGRPVRVPLERSPLAVMRQNDIKQLCGVSAAISPDQISSRRS